MLHLLTIILIIALLVAPSSAGVQKMRLAPSDPSPLATQLAEPVKCRLIITNDKEFGAYAISWKDGQVTDMPAELTHHTGITEQHLGVVMAGGDMSQGTETGHAFVVRSDDFQQNMMVIVEKGDVRPFRLVFLNMDSAGSGHHIELKHGDSGYAWITSGTYIAHDTDENHLFSMFDENHKPLFSVRILVVDDEL